MKFQAITKKSKHLNKTPITIIVSTLVSGYLYQVFVLRSSFHSLISKMTTKLIQDPTGFSKSFETTHPNDTSSSSTNEFFFHIINYSDKQFSTYPSMD